jgi:hypothetical protein
MSFSRNAVNRLFVCLLVRAGSFEPAFFVSGEIFGYEKSDGLLCKSCGKGVAKYERIQTGRLGTGV